jgi:hypothetical protein
MGFGEKRRANIFLKKRNFVIIFICNEIEKQKPYIGFMPIIQCKI